MKQRGGKSTLQNWSPHSSVCPPAIELGVPEKRGRKKKN